MKLNPPIRHGSIVAIRAIDRRPIPNYLGIVVKNPTWEPMTRLISIPGIGEVEAPFESCYNVTEAERKLYFKLVLKHGT